MLRFAAGITSLHEKNEAESAPAGADARYGEQVFKREVNLFLIPDRRAAIRKAFSLAAPNDLVLLLGKGHENSIIYAEHVMPFDEIEEAKKALAELYPVGK